MSIEELKQKIQRWVDQIGVYNEGCSCWWCINQIQKGINEAIEQYKIAHQENIPEEKE